MRSLFAAAIVLLAPSPAIAADGPEAVYMKFHRAGLDGDLKTMARHASEAQQGRMKIDAKPSEPVRKLQSSLPTSYGITGRAAGSTRVVLNMHGTGGDLAGEGGASRGKVTLIKEGEEWKVDRVEWLAGGAPTPPPAARQSVDAFGGSTPAPPPPGASPPTAAGAPAPGAPAPGAPAAAAPAPPTASRNPWAPPPPKPPSSGGFNPATQRPPGMGEPPR